MHMRSTTDDLTLYQALTLWRKHRKAIRSRLTPAQALRMRALTPELKRASKTGLDGHVRLDAVEFLQEIAPLLLDAALQEVLP